MWPKHILQSVVIDFLCCIYAHQDQFACLVVDPPVQCIDIGSTVGTILFIEDTIGT